ncbi:hypothetical protein SUGI_0781530 [Cryptomeria japonica]|nr:hypothetical protein SUGI_0781530 [Cryptomeria japonica]
MGGDATDSLVSALDRASAVLSVLIVMAFLILLQRCFCSLRRVDYMGSDELGPEQTPAAVPTMGLNKESVDSLPIFEYKSQRCTQGLECAVCLSEFQENEKCRILSNCNHSFHIECIDMWFYSHSTCPLCRTAVQPYSPSKVRTDEEVSISSDNSGGMNGSVHTHLMNGQTSSTAVQYQNPPNVVVLWVRENEMDHGVPTGRP